MKLLILEDEPLAIKGLEDIVRKNFENVLIHRAQSIKDGEILLETSNAYDLIISDIRLTDGLSFELFKKIDLDIPIIFSTAYDQYALDAFEHNGVAYVLKPVKEEKLVEAIRKAKSRFENHDFAQKSMIDDLENRFSVKAKYKKRILSKIGNRVIIKPVEEISLFYVENKAVYMKEKHSNKKYVINHSLDELELDHLDPEKFHRINRSVIINFDSLLEMNNHINGRLKLKLQADNHLDLIVSRDRVSQFKAWINQ